MLRWRILLGGIFILCMTGLCWLDHTLQPRGLVLGPFAVLLTVLATGELLRLLRAAGARPAAAAAYFGAALPVTAVAATPFVLLLSGVSSDAAFSDRGGGLQAPAGESFLGPVLLLSVVLCSVAAVRAYDGSRHAALNFAATVFAVTYLGGTVAMLALVRQLPGERSDRGLLVLAATIAIVKAGDIGAYTVGRLFGRHKLAPRLSPGKTWEGAVGAVLFSCLVGILMYRASGVENESPQQSVLVIGSWLVFSAVLAAAGMIGDLAESLLKRSAGVKDSSEWMPGFGGVLDVLDSLLLAAPIAYLFARLGLIGA